MSEEQKLHVVNSFIITITNIDEDNAGIRIVADPPIPEDADDIADTPNVNMVEEIMEYLNDNYGNGDWSPAIDSSGKVH